MQKQYAIKGMTCGGCVAKVKDRLSAIQEIEQAEIKLDHPQGEITFSKPIPIEVLQAAIGQFEIAEINSTSNKSWWKKVFS